MVPSSVSRGVLVTTLLLGNALQQVLSTSSASRNLSFFSSRPSSYGRPFGRRLVELRGGDTEEVADKSLDEKVYAAMRKLGLKPPVPEVSEQNEVAVATTETAPEADPAQNDECANGVCPMPTPPVAASATAVDEKLEVQQPPAELEDPQIIVDKIAKDMNVDASLVWAAVGATATIEGDEFKSYDEAAARAMIQQELDMIATISEDSADVQQLVSEGFDPFLSRRALAFADANMEDARAILLADQMDEEEERQAEEKLPEPPKTQAFKTVNVSADFDPSKISTEAPAPVPATNAGAPKPANKADVVFEATAADIQKLVFESPVPVLVDVYADWCGPCKVLGPVLEEMAIKMGGAFRLVKINSDNERAVSGALEVTALPTVFGFRDGKILNMFQGMPQSEDAMKNFMMGLMVPGGEASFDPPVTATQKEKFAELSTKLLKVAGAACFPFSARERLQDRVASKLEELAKEAEDFVAVEESLMTVRSLLANVVRDPYETKFRAVNLANKVIAARVGKYTASVAILRSVGFAPSQDGETLTLGAKKKVVNVAPLSVARDSIDKWLDKSRYDVARAARKRKDDLARQKLLEEQELTNDEEQDAEDDEEPEVDPDACSLKLRMDGKKKVHELDLRADDPLSILLEHLPVSVEDGEEIQITCVAKRLIVKSSSSEMMSKSLRELGLAPSAAVVVAVGSKPAAAGDGSSLADRAAAQKKLKKGSHTMQSIGIYAKDDNAKGELIDGGGGTWYEHDVSDDDEEDAAAGVAATEEAEEADKDDVEAVESLEDESTGDEEDEEEE